MKERRRATRHKSFLRGNIQFNNGRNTADCLIRDISIYGARLTFSDSITTPDVIDIYIPQKEQTFHAQVIWRHGQELGVAFTQVTIPSLTDQHGEPGDLAGRVERLEAELTAMKRMLKRLKADAGPDSEVA
jgi:hypothetical protein